MRPKHQFCQNLRTFRYSDMLIMLMLLGILFIITNVDLIVQKLCFQYQGSTIIIKLT